MTRIIPLLLAFTLLNYSCKTDSSRQKKITVVDSVLRKYISIVDVLPYYDTTTIEFRLLKAYSLNDTSTLKKIVRQFEIANKEYDLEITLDSLLNQEAFNDLISEEKYRFIYSSSFCPYITTTTIVKFKNSTVLNTVVYQHTIDSLTYKIVDQSTFSIDSLRWEKFQESMEVADFWGLKHDNRKHGVDGSTLEVYGFKKGTNPDWDPDKSSFISRWSLANISILNCFILLLKYSNTKKGCLWPL